MVRIDLDQPAFASGTRADLIPMVVWAGSGRHVTDVWVAGRQVVEDRELTQIDRAAVQAEAQTIGERLAAT